MTGEGTNAYYRLKSPLTSARKRHRAWSGENQRYCQAANRSLASQAESVWPSVGTNQGDDSIRSQLLQLELAA
jgi:hypothetical protein